MKELFLPYNLALIAKEKGFKIKEDNLLRRWYEDGYGPKLIGIGEYYSKTIDAPLYQQIITWFKDKYKIVVQTELTTRNKFIGIIINNYTKTHIGSGNFLYFDNELSFNNEFKGYNTIYRAWNKTIEEAFKLI